MSLPDFREGFRNRNRDAFIRQLHQEAPLYKNEMGFWVVSRFTDAREVLFDHSRFSSNAMGAEFPLLGDDPPRHTHLRRLVSKAFTPSRMEAMRPDIELLARDLVARIEPERELDIVAALTTPLPVIVIARMMGIPEGDSERFKQWSNGVTGMMDERGRQQTLRELRDYVMAAIAERRAAPAEDLIGALVRADEAGVQLSDDEVVGFSILLLIAGNETTTNLLGSLLNRLAAEPASWARLKAKPELRVNAIEEALRVDSPAQLVTRIVREDTTLAGTELAKGETVMVYLAAANRDAARFSDPDRFDFSSERERHIAFGWGVHTCIGAPLARMEAQIALGALLERFAGVRPGTGRARRLPSGVLSGFRELPLVFHE